MTTNDVSLEYSHDLGAAGYTGGIAAEHAASAGLDLVLAGREQDRARLEALADRFGAGVRLFSIDDPEAVATGLEGVSVLLNAAEPIHEHGRASHVCRDPCRGTLSRLLGRTRYIPRGIGARCRARAAGVMLLPGSGGSGGSVAMLGSLAGHAVARVKNARKISIALHVAGAMSRGSVISANQNITPETLHLVDGDLATRSPEEVRDFDFGSGPQSSFPVTLPDLLTIHQATGAPDIETFVHVTAGAFPTGEVKDLPAGPSFEEREASRYHASVEVTTRTGRWHAQCSIR